MATEPNAGSDAAQGAHPFFRLPGTSQRYRATLELHQKLLQVGQVDRLHQGAVVADLFFWRRRSMSQRDLCVGPCAGNPADLLDLNGTLLFTAADASRQEKL